MRKTSSAAISGRFLRVSILRNSLSVMGRNWEAVKGSLRLSPSGTLE